MATLLAIIGIVVLEIVLVFASLRIMAVLSRKVDGLMTKTLVEASCYGVIAFISSTTAKALTSYF
jgi:hypothetical protein